METSMSSGGSTVSSAGGGERYDLSTPSAVIENGKVGRGGGCNGLSAETKETYRALYTVAKQLDDERKQINNISQLFHHDIEEKRAQVVQLCKQIIFKDFQSIGKKAREILWRKGYYEFIAYVKKNWNKEVKDAADKPGAQEKLQKLERFLCAGISNYKRMAITMEEIYDLDLKYLIDFAIIGEGGVRMRRIGGGMREDFDHKICIGDAFIESTSYAAVDKSLEAVSFALDTIHSALLSLGDLHRYFIDFRIDAKPNVNKELAAKYYFEAFKLNPAIGMAQNQLGTLYYGQNYDLDSIYHYLYSLVSIVPFELSENNVCKLFATHAVYLEKLDPAKTEFSLRDFYARFYLIVDIFFFDKEVPDFNALCHCVLVDLRKVLCSKALNITQACIFKIISILFFCLSKLKMINSQKVYSLNAFLVAVCSDLIDACIVNLEQSILARSQDNEEFHAMYAQRFEEFDTIVRKSRNEYKNWLATAVGDVTDKKRADKKDKKSLTNLKAAPLKESSSDSKESQRSLDEHDSHVKGVHDHVIDQILTRSSDEAKESDLKTPLSSKSKRRGGMKLRRRRRKIAQSDDSSCYDTESDMDTDFSTDEEDYTDLSSNFETDFSDIDLEQAAENDQEDRKNLIDGSVPTLDKVALHCNLSIAKESVSPNGVTNGRSFSDAEDVVFEGEEIIYPGEMSKHTPINPGTTHSNSQEINSEELLRSFEVLQLNGSDHADLLFKNDEYDVKTAPLKFTDKQRPSTEPPKKLIYRNKYTKINPNVIVDFAQNEPTMPALKILFEWLRINHEILFGCYHSNPEFIHKIMKLLNYCNIDIFTRKVYFEREFLTTSHVRQGLVELFDVRANVPLSEDFIFKSFDIFQSSQITLDWETTLREAVTPSEENILRIFKMVDFGFFICKQKKFNYRFCVKTRKFTENIKKKRDEKKTTSSRRRERRTAKTSRKRVEGRTRRYSDRKNGIVRKSYTSNEEKDTVEECKKIPRKGYLRNRNSEKNGCGGGVGSISNGDVGGDGTSTVGGRCEKVQSSSGADEERSEAMNKKCEIMGKLWLKNEVKTLEEELRKDTLTMIMTPFLVVDAKALTEYNGIVKNLVKSKKFIVLIPNIVFNELDGLKKRSENARNVIRWLEKEFKHGNRHMRAQRDNENLSFALLKIPRKLDREASAFFQIAQFCNHLVANHTDSNSTEFQSNVVTYLSGDSLYEKQRSHINLSFTGILDSIPVRYYQIANFYSKFKMNKK